MYLKHSLISNSLTVHEYNFAVILQGDPLAINCLPTASSINQVDWWFEQLCLCFVLLSTNISKPVPLKCFETRSNLAWAGFWHQAGAPSTQGWTRGLASLCNIYHYLSMGHYKAYEALKIHQSTDLTSKINTTSFSLVRTNLYLHFIWTLIIKHMYKCI